LHYSVTICTLLGEKFLQTTRRPERADLQAKTGENERERERERDAERRRGRNRQGGERDNGATRSRSHYRREKR